MVVWCIGAVHDISLRGALVSIRCCLVHGKGEVCMSAVGGSGSTGDNRLGASRHGDTLLIRSSAHRQQIDRNDIVMVFSLK